MYVCVFILRGNYFRPTCTAENTVVNHTPEFSMSRYHNRYWREVKRLHSYYTVLLGRNWEPRLGGQCA
jgi:hypothetical protein